ncbi:MAG: hypothetical protein EX260_09845, partial [Desulfobulbaceae bacterium]
MSSINSIAWRPTLRLFPFARGWSATIRLSWVSICRNIFFVIIRNLVIYCCMMSEQTIPLAGKKTILGTQLNCVPSTYLDDCHMNNTAIEVYGVPWDEKSSFLQGCRDAPAKIWDAFNCASANRCTESGLSLTKPELLSYRGMLELSSGDQVVQQIERAASDIGAAESLPIFLGGDHAITYPLVKGLRKTYPKLNIIHFDAHPDLYDKIRGDGFSHGCPMARIMEEKLAVRLVSVGIRTMTPHQRSQAEKYG